MMMFADDIVISSEGREQVKENMQRWKYALERRVTARQNPCGNEREASGTVRFHGVEEEKVQEFKYLGSTVMNNGECGKGHVGDKIRDAMADMVWTCAEEELRIY